MDLDTLLALRAAEPLTYGEYLDLMARQAAAEPPAGDTLAAERARFIPLNLQRSRRIGRTWRPSSELAALLHELPGPQTWVMLTEPWCGDSAQCLPCVAIMAAVTPDVTVRVFLRDENPAIMDRFLTDGKRGIPLVALFDAGGQLFARWGPRPVAARDVFLAAKSEGLPKPAALERLHRWYARDRGRAVDAEFRALFARLGATR